MKNSIIKSLTIIFMLFLVIALGSSCKEKTYDYDSPKLDRFKQAITRCSELDSLAVTELAKYNKKEERITFHYDGDKIEFILDASGQSKTMFVEKVIEGETVYYNIYDRAQGDWDVMRCDTAEEASKATNDMLVYFDEIFDAIVDLLEDADDNSFKIKKGRLSFTSTVEDQVIYYEMELDDNNEYILWISTKTKDIETKVMFSLFNETTVNLPSVD